MIVTLRTTGQQVELHPKMRRLFAIEYAYQRGLVVWQDVARAEEQELPPCQVCQRPANFGGWRQDERLCIHCAEDRWAMLADCLGRAPTPDELCRC